MINTLGSDERLTLMNATMVSNSLYMQYLNPETPKLQEMQPIDRGKEVLSFEADKSVVIKVEPELPSGLFRNEDEKEQIIAQKIDRNFMFPPDVRLTNFPKFEQAYYFPYDMQCPRPMNFEQATCFNWNEPFFGKPQLQPVIQDRPISVPPTDRTECQRPQESESTDFCPLTPEVDMQQQSQITPKRRNTRKIPETPERRAARLAAAAERERRRRANETEEQRRIRREANARRSRLRRASEPEHLRRARLEANAKRARLRRAAAAATAAAAGNPPTTSPTTPETVSSVPTAVAASAAASSSSSSSLSSCASATSSLSSASVTEMETSSRVIPASTPVTEVTAVTTISHQTPPAPHTNVPPLNGFASLLCTAQNCT